MPENNFSKINLAGHGFIERARILDDETGSSLCDTISKMESETMTDKQLLMLSRISSSISAPNVKDQRRLQEYHYEILCHVFLFCESKSPLKQAAMRLLSKFPKEYYNEIATYISRGLVNLMKNDDCESFKHTSNKICDCFENFPAGITAVSLCLSETLSFISNCLHLFHSNISENLSPIQLMDVILKCHSTLRAAVTVLQKYLAVVQEKAQNGDMSIQKSLKDMMSVSVKLINNELVPLDSKGNCGIVVVILFACLHEDGYNVVLDKLLSKTSAFPTVDDCVQPVYFASEVAQMSICSGLVTVTPAEILFSINRNQEKYFLEMVFMKLISLDEGIESSLSLGCSRALQQALHTIHDAVMKNSSSDCILMLSNTQILLVCLDFVWSRMEHFMDCVRHAAKAMLQDLVQIGSTFKERDVGDTSFLQSILAAVEKIPSYKKSKYIALAVLASEIGCQKLLTVFPCLAATLLTFLEDPSLSAHVSNAYESLMLKHFKEEGMDVWISAWISPLFEAYPKSNVCYVIEGIIKKAMAVCPALLDYAVSLYGEGNSLTSSQLKVFIVCLKIGTKLGVVEKRFRKDSISNGDIKWMGIMKYDIIKQALMNKDDEVRLSALSLIVESNKTTQSLKPVELELMKCFMVYNVNSDVPSLRQKNLMLLMKFLVRVKDSSFPLLKLRSQHKDKGGKACETLVGYWQFLKWFEQFCYKCLFPGASHPRRASALEMLTMLNEIISSTDKPVLIDDKHFLYSKNWQENHAESLLLCLRDSFESNKALALNLLMKYPAEIIGFTNPSKVKILLTTSLRLASSVKPPDCITGAYLLKLLVSFPETEGKLEEVASEITSSLLEDFPSFSKETSFYEKSTFCMVWILVAQLERELAAAKVNILVAAANGPLYGTLFCIRNLLKNLDFECVAENPFWKKMILKLIPLCFEINSAVIHIVNSSSPEGHLPMDFAPAITKESLQNIKESEETEDSSDKLSPVTAQMVLLCSWRTVKEVSLFLGDVTNQASIYSESSPQAQECSLLSEDLVISIGDYFTKLLSETKHRGAFEQAYVGFCNICKKLWKQPSGILSQLPKIWLKDITNEITRGKQASKLCATRRSAGVPFIVQALVTTELDVSQPSCLKEAMESLLTLLEKGSGQDLDENVRTESCTHAMNILRALFRHSLLGELVAPYVSRGVMAAVNGFKGDTWASRNAATLLFGALIIRIFGVKHSRDELNRRNRMTGRVFFERFPSLYDFLLGELKEAADVASKKGDSAISSSLHLFPSLFPVLLILSRLYPSSLEGTDSNLQLSAFIPFVECCLKSKIYKTRELAARAMVPLITSNVYVSHLDGSFSKAMNVGVEQNYIHGILLQISYLLLEVPYPQEENEKMLCEKIESWVNKTKRIFINTEEFSYLVKEAYMRVLRHLLLISSGCVDSAFSDELWNNMFELIKNEMRMHCTSHCDFKADSSYLGNVFMGRATQVLLEIAVIVEHTSQMLVDLLCSLLSEPFPIECKSVAFSFLCHLFGEVSCECLEEEDGLPQFPWPTKDHWRTKMLGHRDYISKSGSLGHSAVAFLYCKTPSYVLHRALKVLGYLRSSAVLATLDGKEDGQYCEYSFIFQLIGICNTEPESVGRAALFCLPSLLHEAISSNYEETLCFEVVSEYCPLLMNYSSIEKSESSRMVVAETLVTHSFLLLQEHKFLNIWDRCHMWVILLDLMEDHNPVVRESAAKILECFPSMEEEQEGDPLFPEADGEKEEREQCEGVGDKWMEPDIPISFEVVDIMPQRLEEMLLTLMAKTFGSAYRYQYVITLLSLALRDRASDENEFDLNEERVFDKGEANLFAEPLNLTKMCVKTLKRMHLDSSLLDVDSFIPCSMLALTGLEGCEVTSITNFLKQALSRVIRKLNVCGKNSGGQLDAFLTQGFDSLQQDVFKVGLILYTFKELSKEIGDLYEELCKSLESAGIHDSFQTFCECLL